MTINSLNNDSTAGFLTIGTGIQREFRTALSATAVTQTAANELSFQTRFAFMSAIQVESGGPAVALTNTNHALHSFTFTVEDVANVGYSLLVETLLNGFISLRTDNPAPNSVGTLQGSMGTGSFYYSVDGGPSSMVLGLSGLGGLQNRNSIGTPNVQVNSTKSETLGAFVGTHTFTFSYQSLGHNTATLLGNNQLGESALRFGASPTYAGFTQADTPGPDGTPSADLGVFTSVTAQFNAPVTVVPEPSSLCLTACVVAALLLAVQRRK